MNRHAILGRSVLVATCALLAGCAQDQRICIGDPRPMVHCLIERNRLASEGEARVGLPSGDAWNNLTLAYFDGGVAVGWSGAMTFESPLVFDSAGTFICQPLQYEPTHVTGVGACDLVTAEYGQQGICFYVYTLGKAAAARTLLGSMSKYAYGPERFPVMWDFDDDGVYEIICRLPASSLPKEVGLRFTNSAGVPLEWLITIWSVRRGVPKIMLALSDCDYELPGGISDGLYAEGRKIQWDSSTGRFAVPNLPGVQVLVNQGK